MEEGGHDSSQENVVGPRQSAVRRNAIARTA
jgi:hypothetical protein